MGQKIITDSVSLPGKGLGRYGGGATWSALRDQTDASAADYGAFKSLMDWNSDTEAYDYSYVVRTPMKFNFASHGIPAGSTITSVKLHLYHHDTWTPYGSLCFAEASLTGDRDVNWFNDFAGWASSGAYSINRLIDDATMTSLNGDGVWYELSLNANGISAVEDAIAAGSYLDMMILHKELDVDDGDPQADHDTGTSYFGGIWNTNYAYLEINYSIPTYSASMTVNALVTTTKKDTKPAAGTAVGLLSGGRADAKPAPLTVVGIVDGHFVLQYLASSLTVNALVSASKAHSLPGAMDVDALVAGVLGNTKPCDLTTRAFVCLKEPFGYYLDFNGTDNYINTALNPATELGQSITLSAWVYPHAQDNYDGVMGNHHQGGSSNGILIQYDSGWTFKYSNGSAYIGKNIGNITLNTWTHIAMVVKTGAGGYVKVFVNGIENTPQQDTTELIVYNEYFYIGRAYPAANRYFNGLIDDVRVWNAALTQAEIQATMYQELTGSESNLAGYWKFNEGSGITAFDTSPNNNNGTLIGTPTWQRGAGPLGNNWFLSKSGADILVVADLDVVQKHKKTSTMTVVGLVSGPLGNTVPAPLTVDAIVEATSTNAVWGWLLIPDYLNWQGVWSALTQYVVDDVVLYQDGSTLHVFRSLTNHNTGNLPTDSAHWFRVNIEVWRQ